MPTKLIVFDCDSTLSAIEGVDELARVRGPVVFAEVEKMTHAAMNGALAVEAVFAERLRIIQPRREDLAAVARLYTEQVEPTAIDTLNYLRAEGWTPIILSGGFRDAIRPFADHLGIDRVEAVDLYFNEDGTYRGFDESYPTTRSGGKPEVIQRLRTELHPNRIIMVGDGVSDLETQPFVDTFIGFGRFTPRPPVRAAADHFILALNQIPPLL
ncbi:MAG: HAD-IB family phosphatase [Opitutales bacterium]|nr:HAD-IB family phosphatase [Opitutales bacterium]